MGLEPQGVFENNLRHYIREENTWLLRAPDEQRPWGGVNLGLTGDFWQFRPVRATALFDDPFTKRDNSATDRMLSMFWTSGPDSVQDLFELTKENRQKDPWLSCFLKGARHGNQQHELYCFMHGLPTKHAGSWLPTTGKVLCGNQDCMDLAAKWTAELLNGSQRSWAARQSEECSVCNEHRQKRGRVIYPGQYDKMQPTKFLDAPLIHPFNAPKYHASLIRAKQYAFRTGRILLWAPAEDQPCHPDHTTLTLSLIHI
mgnify:CR=1 FL=1